MIHGGSRRRRRKLREEEQQKAGVLGDIGGAVSGGYDAVAGAGDFLAGSTDEAIGRQFDDDPGGGIVDGFKSITPGLSQSNDGSTQQSEDGVDTTQVLDGSGSSGTESSDMRDDLVTTTDRTQRSRRERQSERSEGDQQPQAQDGGVDGKAIAGIAVLGVGAIYLSQSGGQRGEDNRG